VRKLCVATVYPFTHPLYDVSYSDASAAIAAPAMPVREDRRRPLDQDRSHPRWSGQLNFKKYRSAQTFFIRLLKMTIDLDLITELLLKEKENIKWKATKSITGLKEK
jgi:hypothetical protein